MDFLNGGELFYHLRRENYFKESRAKFYAIEMLLALECLHKNGVIYRDLKPENVILDAQGHLKLTDFGLSKLQKQADVMTFTFCGTPEYLAPEIIKGKGHNNAVDWWSLGLMIYEMLSGINPFKVRGKTNAQRLQMITDEHIPMMPMFTEEAKSILAGLLQKDPQMRLGARGIQEIKDHIIFQGVDWTAYEQKSIEPPFVPMTQSELDIQNIDKTFTREIPRETPEGDSMLQQRAKFDNFTFIEDNPLVQGELDV